MKVFLCILACTATEPADDKSPSAPSDDGNDDGPPPHHTDSADGETGDTGTATDTDTTVVEPVWDGAYAGTIRVDTEIVPYPGDPPYIDWCTGAVNLTVDSSTGPTLIEGDLTCTFDYAGYEIPGKLHGVVTLPDSAAGQIQIGGFEMGQTPIVDGPWAGSLSSPSGAATLDVSFVGDFRVYDIEISWSGTFNAVR